MPRAIIGGEIMRDALKELNSWVETCVAEHDPTEMDPSDYAFDCADGCQWAICYGMAWDLMVACRYHAPEMLDEANSSYSDVFPNDDVDVDTRMTRLAYLIAHDALTGALS
jgi:hypothetical protein